MTLLETGDTARTPTVGCDCETCLAAYERGIERTCSSVHMQDERTDESFLVDFNPDFRHQSLTQDVLLPDKALVTHIHFSHLDGLDNVYRLLDDLPVHVADEVDPVMGESVADAIRSRFDYLDRISVEDRTPLESFRVCGLGATSVPIVHPPLVCHGIAIEDPETGAKLSLSGDMTYAISEASRDVLRDSGLFLVEAIIPASACEYHPIGSDDYDEDEVARAFDTKHMIREGTIVPGEELNIDETRPVHVAHYCPVNEAFGEPLAVDGEAHDP